MGQPYIGEIRMFAGNFPPNGWAFCDGSLLAISENDTLFQLIGTTYGGDGQSTFALPDLRGRLPVHPGQGPGMANYYTLGEAAGQEEVTLTSNQIPAHSHGFSTRTAAGSAGLTQPGAHILAGGTAMAYSTSNPNNTMAAAIVSAGGSQPHSNLMPSVCMNHIISLFGVFPSPKSSGFKFAFFQ